MSHQISLYALELWPQLDDDNVGQRAWSSEGKEKVGEKEKIVAKEETAENISTKCVARLPVKTIAAATVHQRNL
ncbi:hypothetical protein evm_011548 [Chilo suppressalis]|nr:hypothetical protein evm_011548 [Chilo suppressalis]